MSCTLYIAYKIVYLITKEIFNNKTKQKPAQRQRAADQSDPSEKDEGEFSTRDQLLRHTAQNLFSLFQSLFSNGIRSS